jgi:hypothetical protein
MLPEPSTGSGDAWNLHFETPQGVIVVWITPPALAVRFWLTR